MKSNHSQNIRWQIEEATKRYRRHEESRAKRTGSLDKLKAARSTGDSAGVDWREIDSPQRVMRRLNSMGLSKIASEAMVALPEAAEQPRISLYERILDRNNLSDVSMLYQFAATSRAVGRLQVRTGNGRVRWQGTGFLVSPNLVLTNNHVLQNRAQAKTAVIQFDYYDGLRGHQTREKEFKLRPDRFFQTDRDLDFSLVGCDSVSVTGDAITDFGWIPLIRESGKAVVGEPLNIVQHPGGNPKQVVVRDNHLIDVPEDFLHYRADTEPGSSGSPVLNDNCELAALHHSGVPERNDEGEILLIDGTPWDGTDQSVHLIAWKANEGVRISRIAAHLDSVTLGMEETELYNKAFDGNTPSPETILGSLSDERREGELSSESSTGASPIDQPGPRLEADGSVSWYFRFNAGPLTGAHAPSIPTSAPLVAPTGPPIPTPSSTSSPSVPQLPGTNSPSNPVRPSTNENAAFQRAQAIVDEAWNERPYYDEASDRKASDSFYKNVDSGVGKKEFYQQLSELLTDTHTKVLSYKIARWDHLYPWIDRHPSGNLRNIYSGAILDPAEILAEEIAKYERAMESLSVQGFSAEQFSGEGLEKRIEQELLEEANHPFNCEHIVPQSWFQKKSPPKTDLHHLFTCESGCNSFRGNYAYYDFDPLDEAIREDCGRREGGNVGEKKFEPEFGKGAAARATLYFLLRYPGEVTGDVSEFPKERIKHLVRWHKAEKVDLFELHRNAAVAEIQGNRNPLIDFPSWVDKIDFTAGLA